MAELRSMESTALHMGFLVHKVVFFKRGGSSYLSIGSTRERGYIRRDPKISLLKTAGRLEREVLVTNRANG
jgi:hypothetical protein